MSATAPAAAPVPGPLAQGANNRFGTFKYETPNSSASRAPTYTALNLGSLFGGGQPAVNPNVPAAAAAPMSGRVPGPLAGPPGRMQMASDALASAVSKPNWWQSLGRPDMNPDQLARAVKKRNWYQNV